jgi:hypothetical protein
MAARAHLPARLRSAGRGSPLGIGGHLWTAKRHVAVAVLGGGGPPDEDGGLTIPGTVNDRLGNNIVELVIGTLLIAMVGWAAAALSGLLVRGTPSAVPAAADPVQEA